VHVAPMPFEWDSWDLLGGWLSKGTRMSSHLQRGGIFGATISSQSWCTGTGFRISQAASMRTSHWGALRNDYIDYCTRVAPGGSLCFSVLSYAFAFRPF